MFTGIITDLGTIMAVEKRGDLRVRIRTSYDVSTIDLGASIACSGVCLTVVGTGEDWFEVDVSAETQRRTGPERWAEGGRLNLERSLRVGDELGGHIVTGHVDSTGEIVEIKAEGASKRFTFRTDKSIAPYLAAKGSVALDGVSLTVNDVRDLKESIQFSANVIPHTAEWTTFGRAQVGERVNIEIDVLARYLNRMRQVLEIK